VAVVAPAGPFDRASFEAGLDVLRRRYDVVHGDGLFSKERYLAGSDQRRLLELQGALDDPSVRAVFAARGGYGTLRLLPMLRLPKEPKLLVGFSDVTALHAWFQREGRVSVHAPVITQLGRQAPDSQQRLFSVLESTAPVAPLPGARTLVSGTAEGLLVGGNLAVFTRLLGTPYLPPLDGSILLLEDVGERPYAVDRMWTHLRLAGVFERVKGIALGAFTQCEEKDATYSSQDVLLGLAEETRLPCAQGFSVGHGDVNLALPLGVRARLDADAGVLHFLEGACA
jgi:muramoyltetrapeptide carboxypeptidase